MEVNVDLKEIMKNNVEATVLKEVQKVLIRNTIFFQRLHTAGIITMTGIVKDLNAIGRADVICVIRGQAIAIETKSLIGVQKTAQELWEKRFVRAGGHYYLIRDQFSLDTFKLEYKLI